MTHRIAVRPGDGIGADATRAALQVLDRALPGGLAPRRFDGSCAHCLRMGAMMPADGIDILRGFGAILPGAVGWLPTLPDAVSLHGLLLPTRKAFRQYANIRLHRLLPGVGGRGARTPSRRSGQRR